MFLNISVEGSNLCVLQRILSFFVFIILFEKLITADRSNMINLLKNGHGHATIMHSQTLTKNAVSFALATYHFKGI